METCKTIKIKAATAGDYVLINESDFDEKKHEIYTADGAKTTKQYKSKVLTDK